MDELLLKDMQPNISSLDDYSSQIKTFREDQKTYYKSLFSVNCAFMALGTVENILVCCVLSQCRIGRSTTTKLSNFFILHLAITDLVFRAVSVIRRTSGRENLDLSLHHCQLAIFSQFTCAAVTFVLLIGIAFDRYLHILFPLRSLTIKTRKYFIIISIWLYALMISSGFIASATIHPVHFPPQRHTPLHPLLNMTRANITNFKPFRTHCIPGISGSLERKIAFTIYFVFAFAVPLILIIFAYTKMTVFLWKRTKTNNAINSSMAKAKLKAIQMLILVVFSFLISWGPIMILDMIVSYPISKDKRTFRKFSVRPVLECISQTSSIFNPFIYAFGDVNFRRRLRHCCRRRRGSIRIAQVSPGKMNGENYIPMSNLSPRVFK